MSAPLPVAAAPDRALALARYRRHAAGYDASARRSADIRRATIARLQLAPGERVLDVACGTGLSFPLLAAAVGPGGQVIGIEQSPEMAALARARIAAEQMANVALIEAPVEDAALAAPVDAVLIHFAHDVLRAPSALAAIVRAARPGARIALAGLMYPPRWLAWLDPWVRARARPYMTTFEGLACPWDRLAPALQQFAWTRTRLGTCFVASGRLRQAVVSRAAAPRAARPSPATAR